ncbi:MAG: flagellar motor switch protein FliN [Phycisphaerales bacterium]
MPDEERPEMQAQDEGAGSDAADGGGAGDEDVAAGLAAEALEAVQAAIDDATGGGSRGSGGPRSGASGDAEPGRVELPVFEDRDDDPEAQSLELLSDVNLHVKIELGRTKMLIEDVLRLSAGSVVELDKLAGDPVDVFVNERLVARGEVLVLNDNFCVRVNEIIDAKAFSQAQAQAQAAGGGGSADSKAA